jgi:transcription antitermination factor NusG
MTNANSDECERPAGRSWYVLHVKPRTEKKAVVYLERYRCFRYLPVFVKVVKVQRRKVRREIPVFPGYVFTRLSPEERVEMLKTNLIVRTISVSNPRAMIHQLRQVEHATKSTSEIRRVNPFKAGDYVRVKLGPMRGMEGYVRREGPNATICLNVEILGAAVELSISPEDVEKA